MSDLPPSDLSEESPPTEFSCPRCRKSMEPGYLAVGGRANWMENASWLGTLPFRGDNVVSMTELMGGAVNLSGWRCQGCQLMLLEY